jgi:hypothetical protein
MTNQPASTRAPRLRPWYVKLAYVVASCAVVYLIAAIPVGPGGAGILRSTVAFVLVLLGARLFRGIDEESDAPRPWWRMTGGVRSGVVLGAVLALVALVSVTGYIGLAASTLAHQTNLPALVVNALLSAILSYLYFGSSRRLVLQRREEALIAAREGR